MVQAMAPRLTNRITRAQPDSISNQVSGSTLGAWGTVLFIIPGLMAAGLISGIVPSVVILSALIPFGFVFAVNSSVHSYLIVAYARSDAVSLDVGFYYMANACGRLLGTVLSGWIFQVYGLVVCLFISAIFITFAVFFAALINPLKKHAPEQTQYQ